MKHNKASLLVTLLIASLTITSIARAAGINKREAAQRQSIRTGIEDGSLTRPEATRLMKGQRQLEKKEQTFLADGELTRRERANLHHTADVNRARIYTQRHDDQVRPIDD